ncbi:hypothetical protein ACFOD4_01815 [Pseudoroseomonas globiformis]|uniref:Glycosyl transferase family 28 C-terminal domain-containing protein n=1 Tax=Teichococcus globiformis TaxID=2307229 RepID=A0ABV7FTY0_9PROT
MRPIGYYVHHQGWGHWQRARVIASQLRRPCRLIGSLPLPDGCDPSFLRLPDDALPNVPSRPRDLPESSALHYAPPGGAGLRNRAAILAGWIAENRPALMVVDVSVEVILLSRICGTPVVSMRLAGRRDDAPHLAGFEASEALIAPFPETLDDADLPGWVRDRSFHAGFLAEAPAPPPPRPLGRRILVLLGRGSGMQDGAALAAAAAATPGWKWEVAGPVRPDVGATPNLCWLGWVEDVVPRLQAADVVVGGCGDGVLSEVAAHAKRFVCIPEPRPFAEQESKAARLQALGAAVVLPGWPPATDWPALLDAALALEPGRIAALYTAGAAQRTAAFIDAQADEAVSRYGIR